MNDILPISQCSWDLSDDSKLKHSDCGARNRPQEVLEMENTLVKKMKEKERVDLLMNKNPVNLPLLYYEEQRICLAALWLPSVTGFHRLMMKRCISLKLKCSYSQRNGKMRNKDKEVLNFNSGVKLPMYYIVKASDNYLFISKCCLCEEFRVEIKSCVHTLAIRSANTR